MLESGITGLGNASHRSGAVNWDPYPEYILSWSLNPTTTSVTAGGMLTAGVLAAMLAVVHQLVRLTGMARRARRAEPQQAAPAELDSEYVRMV